ncbi:hypothetical protein [Niabella aquatica]
MKTIKTLSLFICLTFAFTACKKDKAEQRKTYLAKLTNSNGITTFAYNAANRLVSTTFTATDGTVTTQTYSDFNAAGLPTKSTIVQAGETTTKEMEYDGQNRLTKITVREAGAIYKTVEYIYTAHTMEFSNYHSSGGLWGRFVYNFNAQGNISGYDVYGADNTLTDRITCNAYDNKKSLKEFYYHEDTRPFTSFSTNNITDYQSVSSNTGETITFTHTHEYNTDGYPTRRTLKIMPSGFETTVTYEYEKR